MDECELCGNPMAETYFVSIEGVELGVCAKCAKGKRIVRRVSSAAAVKAGRAEQRRPEKARNETEVIENYGTVMRKAREGMKLPMKVLAEMINEKETLLVRVEQQRTIPPEKLVKKLEKALNIKLEAPVEQVQDAPAGRKSSATMGEFLE